MVVTPSIRSTSKLILDNECSYHMCPNKSFFYSLKAVQTMVIGTGKLKMYDRVVRTLGKVRYVPNMKKNLIPLSNLSPRFKRS